MDIDAGDALVERIKPLARATQTPHVIGSLGGFAGLCAIPGGYREPVLVSGTDGVGTKLKVAFATGKHDSVGIDLVAMCVNDVITVGAAPLFFLDYFATGRLRVEVGEAVVAGIAEGCKRAGCALLGGETAELPGMYPDGEYDLAGFCVGVVERDRRLDKGMPRAGDAIVGIASSGLHSNGYSLARKVVEERMGLSLRDPFPGMDRSAGEVLLEPTRIYAKAVAALLSALETDVRGLVHITGGGLVGNVPRVLGDDVVARLDLSSYERPVLFRALAEAGPVDEAEMQRTFNLGVGMCAIVAKERLDEALRVLREAGEVAFQLGVIDEPTSGETGGSAILSPGASRA